jgi:hypothetical protein
MDVGADEVSSLRSAPRLAAFETRVRFDHLPRRL